ncbi:MAG: hypothetical protein WD036_10235 [Bauldia sp.]
MLRPLILAAGVAFASPAAAVCLDAPQFRQMLSRWGETVRYAGLSAVADKPTPIYVSVAGDGKWTAFFVYERTMACVIATGSRWTENGAIPRDEPRPVPGPGG